MELIDTRNSHQTKGTTKANTESLMILVSMGSNRENTGLVKTDQQGKGTSSTICMLMKGYGDDGSGGGSVGFCDKAGLGDVKLLVTYAWNDMINIQLPNADILHNMWP